MARKTLWAVLDALEFYRNLGLPGPSGETACRLISLLSASATEAGTASCSAAPASLNPASEAGSRRGKLAGIVPAGEARTDIVAEIRDMETAKREQGLRELRQELGDCLRCGLSAGRKNIVFGVGNAHAELMFVGEGPGAEEDARGLPFVGRAGELLTRMIEAMGKDRDEVYIANIVKCRPPGNRDPQPDEIGSCIPFLYRQIEIIRPAVIVALGRVAIQALLETKTPIGKLRGIFQDFRGIPVMPTYHPAYLLRSPGQKKYAWEDLKQVLARLGWVLPAR